jgi:hypothetical protein
LSRDKAVPNAEAESPSHKSNKLDPSLIFLLPLRNISHGSIPIGWTWDSLFTLISIMNPPDSVNSLVERFERNREAYLSGQYNETRARREFLDPFFLALGWDVENKQGYVGSYKDVVHGDAIKIGSAKNAPDYSFRIGGARKFFVEAKKPAVSLKDEINPVSQLRRYAWSVKLSLSTL